MDSEITHINYDSYTVAYVDASPSELIQNSTEHFLCVGMITFSRLYRNNLRPIKQYKKVRGLKRKLQIQDYIIAKIQNEEILPIGVLTWNYQLIALKNGRFILNDAGLLNDDSFNSGKLSINGADVKLGLATSLSWYSIAISIFLKNLGQIARIQQKKKIAIFLDLLPGDNMHSQKHFEIVECLINNSRLVEFQNDAITENDLEVIGFGYGLLEDSVKDFKNDYEFVITDWIISSFHHLIKYQQGKLNVDTEEYKLSKLARYLIDTNRLSIVKPFDLISI